MSANESPPLRLLEGVGIEIEYMIVDAASLAVRPIADEVLRDVGGDYDLEVEVGPIAWSNELALHVIELKTNGPAPHLGGLGATFHDHVLRVEELLAPRKARLLPGGMHPWMDPDTELRLWPHEADIIYQTFHRIFDCRGHGWANLQSMHINLPFGDDDEFGKLHAAMRVALPILPALAASSPFAGGAAGGALDTRLSYYRTNARRVPQVSGAVVPEQVFTRAEYEGSLLRGIYDALAPHDPEGVIQHEWVNARGCIARFDRSAIEIRLLDTQECPRADIAIAGAVIGAIRGLLEERHVDQARMRAWHHDALAEILWAATAKADHAIVRNTDYLQLFGFPDRGPCMAIELWQHIIETMVAPDAHYGEWREPLEHILRHGSLARRLRDAVGAAPSRHQLAAVYGRLADSLRSDTLFRPA